MPLVNKNKHLKAKDGSTIETNRGKKSVLARQHKTPRKKITRTKESQWRIRRLQMTEQRVDK